MAGCQNSPSFSHYSHANKTSVGSFPGGLTLGLASASHGLRLKGSDGVGGVCGSRSKGHEDEEDEVPRRRRSSSVRRSESVGGRGGRGGT